ncbi:MAG: DUF748 domain-containing protein [Cycloclasticus sp.]|nr:DUF748 domain-containing protein [Cycloclasticus sp.]
MTTDETKASARNWPKKTVLTILIVGGILIALPFAIQFGIIKALKDAGSQTVSIEDVDFNIFTGTLAIKELSAQRLEEPELHASLIQLDIDWLPLFSKRLFISSLSLSDFSITIEQRPDSTLVVAGIEIPPSKEEQNDEAPSDWGVGLDKLALNKNTFRIKSDKFSHDFVINTLTLDDVYSWKPGHSSDFSFNTALNDASIKGDIKLMAFADKPTIQGKLIIDNFSLKMLQPFVQEHVSALDGVLKTNIDFTLSLSDQGITHSQSGLVSISHSTANLTDIKLKHELVQWQGDITVETNNDLLELNLNGELLVNGHQDQLSSPPLDTLVNKLQWKGTTHFTKNNEGQQLAIEGGIDLAGLSSTNRETLLSIGSLKHLKISKLTINELDDIKLAPIVLSELSVAKKEKQQALFSAKEISLSALHIKNLKDISINDLAIQSLSSKLSINKENEIQLINSLNDSLSSTTSKQPTTVDTNEPKALLAISSIKLKGNNVISINKLTSTGTVKKVIVLKNLDIGEINNQKTELQTPFKLLATIDKHANLSVKGKAALFSKKTNAQIKSTLNALELHSFSPISNELIGYSIESGQMNVDTSLNIKQNIMDGNMDIEINQFVLDSTDTKKASVISQNLSMPLDSALSLLRDENDDIKLNIPIKGDVASPDFNISDIINTALANSLQGAVTASLKLALGPYALVYMATEAAYGAATAIHLKPVEFFAGEHLLSNDSITYLQHMGEMMKKSPGLRLKLCGFSTEVDRQALITQAAKTAEVKADAKIAPTINDDRLIELAEQRSTAVKSELLNKHSINPKRLFTCSPKFDKQTGSQKNAKPRVELLI